MSKTNFLLVLVAVLVALNLCVLAFVLLGKQGHDHDRHPHRGGGPKSYIIEKLQLDDVQVRKYESLIRWHRTSIDKKEEEVLQSKISLYALLKSQNYRAKDSIIHHIATLHEEIEQIHFKHFKDIKELCTESQLSAFNELDDELAHLFAHPSAIRR